MYVTYRPNSGDERDECVTPGMDLDHRFDFKTGFHLVWDHVSDATIAHFKTQEEADQFCEAHA